VVPTVGLLTQIREAVAHYCNGGVGVALSALNARRCGLVGVFEVQLGGALLTRSRWGLGPRALSTRLRRRLAMGPVDVENAGGSLSRSSWKWVVIRGDWAPGLC